MSITLAARPLAEFLGANYVCRIIRVVFATGHHDGCIQESSAVDLGFDFRGTDPTCLLLDQVHTLFTVFTANAEKSEQHMPLPNPAHAPVSYLKSDT